VTTPPIAAALPIQWQDYAPGGYQRQLSAEDRPIWNRFIHANPGAFDLIAYDVPIGGQDCDDPDTPEFTRRQWRYCTAKRIDVLALKGTAPTIIEVRYQAGCSAIGALLVYRVLYREHNPGSAYPTLLLLTDTIAPDTKRAAASYGITVLET
jgi:hypothetical protein